MGGVGPGVVSGCERDEIRDNRVGKGCLEHVWP